MSKYRDMMLVDRPKTLRMSLGPKTVLQKILIEEERVAKDLKLTLDEVDLDE